MKTRSGFVSNSSSQSFLLTNPGELPEAIAWSILTPPQARAAIRTAIAEIEQHQEYTCSPEDDKIEIQKLQQLYKERHLHSFYLTQFVSDSGEAYSQVTDNNCFTYQSGAHGGPYDSDYFDELLGTGDVYDEVWILKTDNQLAEVKVGEQREFPFVEDELADLE